MKKKNIIIFSVIPTFLNITKRKNNDSDFEEWKVIFKERAMKEGVSKETLEKTISKTKYLPIIIKYDRYQPEFYEDTKTYISKRSSDKKIKKGIEFYKNHKKIIDTIEKEYKVEKELLLSLMGIETNYGNYLGKIDILSSLATLSFDKRRSEFFSKELLILLKLIEEKKIDYKILYGSWEGAVGLFQFMPSMIKNYGIDYDNNGNLDLKEIGDAYASTANYLSKMNWSNENPCFYKIDLLNNIPKKYLNVSAKLHNKKKLQYFRQYIINDFIIDKSFNNLVVAIITPDSDKLSPAYVVFDNFEIILKWNRSLRFALAVCTLKDKLKKR